MQRVYFSYRQGESEETVAHVSRGLRERFGQARFIGGAATLAGAEASPAAIAENVERAGVVLLLVGPVWLDHLNNREPDDLVLHELECALALEKPVVVLRIDDAALPAPEDLPASCAKLADCKSYVLNTEALDEDLQEALDAVVKHMPAKPVPAGEPKQEIPRHWLMASALIGLLIVIGGFLLTSRFWLDPPPDVVGTWHAQVDYGWGVGQPEEFNFRQTGGDISGNATYLGIRRIAEDVTLENDELSFFTRSREYVGNQQYMLRHEYVGTVDDDRIVFTMQTQGGPGNGEGQVVNFIATRAE